MTLKIGYKASAEQFAPRDLVEFAVLADDLGLDSVMVSDHYQPWRHEGGHAPFSLAWLAAVGERTSNVVLGTSVLTATLRYNPAVLAQAFGTLGCLYPGRVVLGVGSGEALNEVAVARIEWPAFKERFARLREAVDLMRTLWREERVSFEGEYFQTTDATVYDRPDGGVPIYIAAGGPVMAKYVGRQGDGFICTSGKGMDLYTEKLLPALGEGAALTRPSPRSSPTSTRVSTTLSSMAPAMTRNGFSAASRSRCCPACGHWMPDGSGLMAEWAVVIPVKRWAMAKSRVGGLWSADRRDLAAALAHDMIRTVSATPAVARCVVVGPDEVVRELRRCSGAVLGVEEVQERSADPLNTALRQGRDAALAAGYRQIAMIMADMPALTVSGLTAFLQLMPTTGVGVVRDRSRTGTTILAGRAGHTVCPAFGPDSATRHIAGGAIDLTSSCDPGLRIDVDTWADLVAVRRFAGPALRRWFDECAAPRRACPPVTPAALSRNQV